MKFSFRHVFPVLLLATAGGSPAFAGILLRVVNLRHHSWSLLPTADGPKGTLGETDLGETEFVLFRPFQPIKGRAVPVPARGILEMEWDDGALADRRVTFALVDERGGNPFGVHVSTASRMLEDKFYHTHLEHRAGLGKAEEAELAKRVSVNQWTVTIHPDADGHGTPGAGASASAGLELSPAASRAAGPEAGAPAGAVSVLGKRKREGEEPEGAPAAQRPRLAAPSSIGGTAGKAAPAATAVPAPRSVKIRNRSGGNWYWTVGSLGTRITVQHEDSKGRLGKPDDLFPGSDVEVVVLPGVTTLTRVDPSAAFALDFKLFCLDFEGQIAKTYGYRWASRPLEAAGPDSRGDCRFLPESGLIDLWSAEDRETFWMTGRPPMDAIEHPVPAEH